MAGKLTRAAVVGASTLLAKELIAELGDSAAAAWDLSLLDDNEEAEGQLAAAGDEAVVIHKLTEESLSGIDLVFFAGQAELTAKYWRTAVENGSAVIDLTGMLEQEPGFLVRSPWLQAGQRPDLTTAGVVTPQPAALMLALIADRLQRKVGSVDLAATILEPASQAGAAGVDELHQQTVGLLSFQEVPKAIFDAQVAFNLQGALGSEARTALADTRATIRRHALALLGGAFEGKLTLNLLQAPVFHGYTMSVLTQAQGHASEMNLRSALQGGVIVADPETVPSNQAAVESGDVLVSIEADPEDANTAWLFVAADNLRLAARNAIAVAQELSALRPGERVQ